MPLVAKAYCTRTDGVLGDRRVGAPASQASPPGASDTITGSG
jgi:hypothetical protein